MEGVFDRLEVGVLTREASERGPVLDWDGVVGVGLTVDFLVDIVDATD